MGVVHRLIHTAHEFELLRLSEARWHLERGDVSTGKRFMCDVRLTAFDRSLADQLAALVADAGREREPPELLAIAFKMTAILRSHVVFP